MAAKEAIMICFDNSKWMFCSNLYSYGLQLACTRLYCRAKLESNPENAIGFMTLGTADNDNYLSLTSDLDEILSHLKCKFIKGGEMEFTGGLGMSIPPLRLHESSKQKRVLMFAGGPTNLSMSEAGKFGGGLKQRGIGVDVVNFCPNESNAYGKKVLDVLVGASNNNNNSHIKHILPDSSTRIRDVLCRSPALISRSLFDKAMEKEILQLGKYNL